MDCPEIHLQQAIYNVNYLNANIELHTAQKVSVKHYFALTINRFQGHLKEYLGILGITLICFLQRVRCLYAKYKAKASSWLA